MLEVFLKHLIRGVVEVMLFVVRGEESSEVRHWIEPVIVVDAVGHVRRRDLLLLQGVPVHSLEELMLFDLLNAVLSRSESLLIVHIQQSCHKVLRRLRDVGRELQLLEEHRVLAKMHVFANYLVQSGRYFDYLMHLMIAEGSTASEQFVCRDSERPPVHGICVALLDLTPRRVFLCTFSVHRRSRQKQNHLRRHVPTVVKEQFNERRNGRRERGRLTRWFP